MPGVGSGAHEASRSFPSRADLYHHFFSVLMSAFSYELYNINRAKLENIVHRVFDSARFDIRMMFQGYLQRGFVAGDGDAATLTRLLGHEPRAYEDFANEIAREWQQLANSRAAA
jgi:hypothetical protein